MSLYRAKSAVQLQTYQKNNMLIKTKSATTIMFGVSWW